MTRRKSEAVKRLTELEKQIGNRGDKSELFERAMAEVFQEATTEELRTAAGSGKYGGGVPAEEMTAMHELFEQRAEQKVKQYKDEKGKN